MKIDGLPFPIIFVNLIFIHLQKYIKCVFLQILQKELLQMVLYICLVACLMTTDFLKYLKIYETDV